MNKSRCKIHGPNKVEIAFHGHFTYDDTEPGFLWGRCEIDGEEYEGDFKLEVIVIPEDAGDLKGRYFGFCEAEKMVYVCDCRWTRKDIAAIRREARKRAKKIRPLRIE